MTEVERLTQMMRDPRYWRDRDPAIIRAVTEGFRALSEPEPSSHVVLPREPTTEMVERIAVSLLLADKGEPETPELVAWANRASRIGEAVEHSGDCTKGPHACQVCAREHYQAMARAAYRAAVGKGE